MSKRENALKEWLAHLIPEQDYILSPLAGDASFRRYFRLQYNGLSQVIMDAPPGKEDLEPFVHVAQVLTQAKVHTPKLLAKDLQQGFLLLSDLGDRLLLNELNTTTAASYYVSAMDTLLQIQHCSITDPKIPAFNEEFMLKEMALCKDWFFNAYLALTLNSQEQQLIQETMSWVAKEVAKQPVTFIHRDYHSRNLMLMEQEGRTNLGVIDFQDAMIGPLTYDLVSLLKDCYISWPREQVLEWVGYFYKNSPLACDYSEAEFIRAFDLCGLQRHLKVLGIFCRLHLRDNKSGYLGDLPLTLKYVLECTELYSELHPFLHFLQKRVYLP